MTTAPTRAPERPEDMSPSGVSGRPVWALSGEQMLTELDALHIEISQAQTRRLALLAGLDKIGHAKDIGARSTADLIARRHRLDYHQIHRDMKLARALPKYPIVQQALDNGPHTGPTHPAAPDSSPATDDPQTHDTTTDATTDQSHCADPAASTDGATGESTGESTNEATDEAAVVRLGLHPGQAEAIVSSLERVPTTVPVEDIEVAEREMVIAARVNTPSDLRRLGRAALERLDPDGREPNEDAAREKESLSLRRDYTGYGLRFRGFLSNENAELFQALIDACSKPRKITTSDGNTHLDPRGKPRRQADALIQILNTAAATSRAHNNSSAGGGSGASDGHGGHGEPLIGLPAHGGIRPHIMVTINLDDLIQAGKQHTGDLLFGDRLSASAVRMLACDAQIIPIVLGTNSEPLDVGQDFRSVTPAIRMALIARDKGCVICGAPPGWCDAHHLEHFADGGATSVDNGVLGCKPCHREIHKGIWHVTITNGRVRVTGPHYQPRKTKRRTQPVPPERPPP